MTVAVEQEGVSAGIVVVDVVVVKLFRSEFGTPYSELSVTAFNWSFGNCDGRELFRMEDVALNFLRLSVDSVYSVQLIADKTEVLDIVWTVGEMIIEGICCGIISDDLG